MRVKQKASYVIPEVDVIVCGCSQHILETSPSGSGKLSGSGMDWNKDDDEDLSGSETEGESNAKDNDWGALQW